jgi:hypothetical protein
MKEVTLREGVNDSYVSRMVNLTTLAPDIIAAILGVFSWKVRPSSTST